MIGTSAARVLRRLLGFGLALPIAVGTSRGLASAQGYTVPDWSLDSLRSTVLGETRKVSIALPTGYAFKSMADFHYPVLIILDDSYGSMTLASKILDERILSPLGGWIVPQMIVVSIDLGRTYVRDMTPPPVQGQPSPRPGRGGSPAFAKFLEDELLPWLAQRYRTSAYTTVYGVSLAGLFAAWAYGNAPSKINAAIAISPSLHWSKEAYQQVVDGIRSRTEPGRLFVAAGETEGTQIPEKVRQFLKELGPSPTTATAVESQWYTDFGHFHAGYVGFRDGLRSIFRPVTLGGLDGYASTSAVYLPEFERRRAAYRNAAPAFGLPPKLPFWQTMSQVMGMAESGFDNLNGKVLPVLCDELRSSYPNSWGVPVCDGHARRRNRDFDGAALAFNGALEKARRADDEMGIGIVRDGMAQLEEARRQAPKP